MANYTIMGSATDIDSVMKKVTDELNKVNTKLEDKKLSPLSNIVESEYVISCTVDKAEAPDFTLDKDYTSKNGFSDAEAIATKGYGKLPFVVKEYKLSWSYAMDKDQEKLLVSKDKPRTAGRFDSQKDNLTSHFL